MKYVVGFVVGILIAAAISTQLYGTRGARTAVTSFSNVKAVSDWMAGYYRQPEPHRLPDAIAALNEAAIFNDPPKFMTMVGFFAGVIETDPGVLDGLSARLPEAPVNQQKFVALAIALSGRSDWRQLLSNLKGKLPGDQAEIEKLLAVPGWLHVLAMPLDKAEVLDMQWAYFMATGKEAPVVRLMSVLDGTLEETDLRRLGIGYAAKWSLASNAGMHPRVMEICRRQAMSQPEPVAHILKEVIAAGEAHDAGRIRQERDAALRAWKERQQQKKS